MANKSRSRPNFSRNLLTALACAAVLLCQSTRSSTADAAGNVVRPIDVEHSSLKVQVGKEGLFAFAADEHQVNVPIASGSLDEATNSIELTIDAAKMRVLDPPSRRDKVQANMVGPQVLDVAKYPTIEFRSTGVAITAQPDKNGATRLWAIKGDLTLHGQTHPISVLAQDFGPTRFTGSARFKQSTFGITPIKVAGGAVRVKDDVDIVFDVTLK
jgi:polyisoprenoid-binding protein YceI